MHFEEFTCTLGLQQYTFLLTRSIQWSLLGTHYELNNMQLYVFILSISDDALC